MLNAFPEKVFETTSSPDMNISSNSIILLDVMDPAVVFELHEWESKKLLAAVDMVVKLHIVECSWRDATITL
jgi:hypothetical protein